MSRPHAAPHAQGLAPGRPDAPGRWSPTTCPTSTRTCRSSRCSTSSTTGSSAEGEEPIAFEHDCREGICGSCGMMINGQAHGPQRGTATCQLHMRKFDDGDAIIVEPWRAAAFPVVKDLVVNRTAFDRIVEAGGYITVTPGAAPDANLTPVPEAGRRRRVRRRRVHRLRRVRRRLPERRRRSCSPRPRSSHLNLLPQGQPERYTAGRGDGRHDGGVLRLLHEPRRVRGGVPEGDLDRLHRLDEPRLPQGQAQEPPARVTALTRRSWRPASAGPTVSPVPPCGYRSVRTSKVRVLPS